MEDNLTGRSFDTSSIGFLACEECSNFFSKFLDANGRLGNLKRSGDSDSFLLYTKMKGFQVIWGSLGHLGSNIDYGQRLKAVK